ncbi:serine protease nudel isoform X2 [Chelonus insularis]|uniref:serine protease nudel isoform X2 n=1 Tax=Chelonus insularis TaxID=460826 RepID=UPI00158DF044|nr:serine protease nudel-like isoform X2 [Chelonus insularis]
MKNAKNSETPVDNNDSESVYIPMKKKFNKIFSILERKKLFYEICAIFGVIAIIFLLWCLGCDSNIKKTPAEAKFLDTSKELPTLMSYETNMDTKWERFKQEYYDGLLDDSKYRLKRDESRVLETINEVDPTIANHERITKQRIEVDTEINNCKARWKYCTNIINSLNSQAKTASDAIESLKQTIETMKPNSENPSIEELYECLVCESARKSDIKKMDDRGSGGSRPYKNSKGSRNQNVNHVVNVFTNDKPIEGISKVELPTSNGNIQRAVLISKSNTSKIQDGAKITQVIKNRTVIERSEDSDEPVKFYIPFIQHQGNNKKNNHNPNDYSNRMTVRDTTSYNDQKRNELMRNNFNANNPPFYQQKIKSNSKIFNEAQMSQPEPSNPSNPAIIPTAENTQSSQQLRLTPVVPLIPYPLCYYGAVAPAQVPMKPEQFLFPTETGNYYLPPATGFTNPIAPSPFGNTDLNQRPLTGPFQPSAYSSGYPVVPPQVPNNYFGEQRVGPTGPGNLFPGYGYPRSHSPPLYPCPYVTMPTFQFPLVPGVSDLQRMEDSPMGFRNSLGQPLEQPSFRGSTWRESSNSSAQNSQLECKPNYFKCLDNSLCIPIFQRCDGNVDCPDVSDENSCSCKDRITRDKLCDGYFDCPKGEDELGCFGCGNDSFSCQDWTKKNPHGSCVQLSERCDGVQHCPNSKDETDCSILTQSFIENQDLFTIGYSSGYLFKNWRGKWYPVCSPTMAWAIESCASEVGTSSKRTPIVTVESIVRGHTQDSYLTMKPSGQIEIVPECSDKVVFVKCPPIPCGTRVLVKEGSFRPYGVYEDTLVASQQTENVTLNTTLSNSSNITDVIHHKNVDGRSMDSRIVGGRASQPQAWPFLVAIYRDGYFKCGGVIVNEQWISTAAHCVEGHQNHYYQVFAGLLRRFSFSPMAQIRQAKSIIPHHEYKEYNMLNDLALIQLDEGLRFNRWIRAACLPQPQWGNQPTAGDKCTAIGWGATHEHGPDPDHLRDVEVPVLAQCKRPTDHYEGVVCAGLPDGGKDACQGDSGGPLMCKVQKTDTQWYVAGIVSHGIGCALPNEPGAYTRVSHYFHWINETIHRDHPPLGSETLSDCPGFKCSGHQGKCLPLSRRCDKNVDCLDAEDELNCENVQQPTPIFFRGSSNEPAYEHPEINDNVQNQMNDPQSAHGSENDDVMKIDVVESMTSRFIEATTEMTELTEAVTEHSEISVTSQVIDTTQSYPDSLDEPLQFICSRLTQAIPITGRCNKVIECEDGTDEAECSCKDFLVKLHPSSICDGRIDCADESDETNCNFCEENQFTCTRSGTCIPQSKRCDKINDCPLNEDELDCYALTDSTYIGTDFNGYSTLKYKGIVTNLTNQEWRPVCYDIHNTELKNKNYLDSFCQHLGFREHKAFNLRQIKHSPLKVESKLRYADDFVDELALQITNSETNKEELCYGLNIQCELVFNHSVETFAIKDAISQNQTYLWPWEAAIFVDGHYHCPAILLNYDWALSSSRCTRNIDLRKNYTIVLVGLSLTYKYVDGPDQHITQVQNIQNLAQLELSMLRIGLKQISRYVQPIFFDRKFYPATSDDECVAIGTDTKLNTKMTFLQTVLNDCPPCHRCFKNKIIEECPKNETTEDWSGTVTCRGPNGWYPAAIFHEKDIFCEYHTVQSLTSIDYMYAHLMESTEGSSYIPVDPPFCDGKRCSLGNCVTWDRVCDGIQDCRDGSDESITICNEKQGCGVSEMQCKNGMCIPKEKYCNKHADCPDGSDEPAECNCAAYLELAHPKRLCDNIRDCYDKSDENPDMCLCQDISFKCSNSTNLYGDIFCISYEFVCDGEKDCPNGEDEIDCRTVRGTLKDPQGTGEVLRRSYGVWHSECFSAPIETDSEANDLCKSMGYSNGTILNSLKSNEYGPGTELHRENFYIVVFNEHMYMGLRDNKPLVNIVPRSENCHRAFVQCL